MSVSDGPLDVLVNNGPQGMGHSGDIEEGSKENPLRARKPERTIVRVFWS
jgi:hypothetical protein